MCLFTSFQTLLLNNKFVSFLIFKYVSFIFVLRVFISYIYFNANVKQSTERTHTKWGVPYLYHEKNKTKTNKIK